MTGEKEGRARREAARWYAQLQDEEAGPELWRQFEAWERRPGNAAAFRQVEASLSTLDRARAARPTKIQRKRSAWPVGAGIAAALLLVGVVSVSVLRPDEAAPVPAPITYTTGIGEQETLTLEDGSRVVLNTASHVDILFSETERRIELVEGQALFDVTREGRPFVVTAAGYETLALGTRFDVHLSAHEGLQVTLMEGLVSISAEIAGSSIILSPGEQMTLRDGKRAIARVDVSRIESWTRGMIPFTDVTIANAADELNRYSTLKLKVDEAVAQERISGSFRAGDQEGFAAALEAFLPVVAERSSDQIFIRPKD